MILEKILNFLNDFFKKEEPNKKFNDSMKKILSKLNDKALMLEVQLKNEKDERKRKDIKLMLKVISKKKKKGEKLMQEREMYSCSSRRHKIINRPQLSPRIL